MTKEEAIKHLETYSTTNGSGQTTQAQHEEAKRMGIKALEQEPFMNKPCVAHQVCHEDKVKILDKIRYEIETKYGQCDICEYFENYDYEENDISEYRPIGNIADILQIIDKYKTESEVERCR